MRHERPPHGEDIEGEAPYWVYQASISPTGVGVLDTRTLFPPSTPSAGKRASMAQFLEFAWTPSAKAAAPLKCLEEI